MTQPPSIIKTWQERAISNAGWYDTKKVMQSEIDDLRTEIEKVRRETIEECACLATATVCDTHTPTGVKIYGTRAGVAIRSLK